jgi:hypothetical protein
VKQILLLIFMLLFAAIVSRAADNQDTEKDWCLLGVTNKCPSSTTFDIVEKIKRLEIAIKKGLTVYTPEELKHLQAMLADAHETQELMKRY